MTSKLKQIVAFTLVVTPFLAALAGCDQRRDRPPPTDPPRVHAES